MGKGIQKQPPVGGHRRSTLTHQPPDGHSWVELISYTTSIARAIFKRIPKHTCSLEDLIQVGSLGLVQASTTYQSDRGIPFRGYARVRIKGAMQDHLRSLDLLTRLERQKVKAGTSSGAAPITVPLEEAIDEPDRISPDPEMSAVMAEEERLIREAVDFLPDRLRFIYDEHHRKGTSMIRIGEILRVSQSRISQLVNGRLPAVLRKNIEDEYREKTNKHNGHRKEGGMPQPQTQRGGKGKPRQDKSKKAITCKGAARVRSLIYANDLPASFTINELIRADRRFVNGGEYGDVVALMVRREELRRCDQGKYSLSTESPADRGLEDARRLAARMAKAEPSNLETKESVTSSTWIYDEEDVEEEMGQGAPDMVVVSGNGTEAPEPDIDVTQSRPEESCESVAVEPINNQQVATDAATTTDTPVADAPGKKEEGGKPGMAKQEKPERAKRTSQLDRLKAIREQLGDRDIAIEKDWQVTGLGTVGSAQGFFRTAVHEGWFTYVPGKFGIIRWLKDPNQAGEAERESTKPKAEPKKEPAMATTTTTSADTELAALEAKAKELAQALEANATRIRVLKAHRVLEAFLALDDDGKAAFGHALTDDVLDKLGLKRVLR